MRAFDLALYNLADAVCENQPTASAPYAAALKVAKPVLDAELANLVVFIPAGASPPEPQALHLTSPDLHTHRHKLLLELQAMGQRDFPWQQ